MKLCKDCMHSDNSFFPRCNRPIGIDLVQGGVIMQGTFCQLEREVGLIEAFLFRRCGKAGKYFTEREE